MPSTPRDFPTRRSANALRSAVGACLVAILMAVPWAGAAETAAPDPGRCVLDATVVEGEATPVAGAVVRVLGGDHRATSDRHGRVCVTGLDPGVHQLLVIADGYSVLDASITVDAEPLRLTFHLTPAFGEELVVTATRTAKRLLDVPMHVEQISRATIQAAAARTLADAIEQTPGIRIESNCQNCNFSQVRLLGLEGPYSQILVDGQPTVSSLALVYGIEQFPAQMLDSVEVVKGGGAAIYGAGAVGGVINLIPHAPFHTHTTLDARSLRTGGEPGYSLSLVRDWSPDDRRTGVALMAQLDEVEASDRDGDGFTEVSSRQLTTLSARVERLALGDDAQFEIEANWTDASRRGGELSGFDLEPHQTSLTEEIDTTRTGLSLGWVHTVSPRFDYRAAASWADTARDSYYGAGFDANAYGSTDNPLWIVDTQVNWYRGQGTVTAGAQYSRDHLDDRQPGYGRELRETNTNLGLFVQDDRRLGDKATVVYGVRADQHSALDEPVYSPRLAVMVSPRSDTTVRLSLADGFRAPEVFDEDLHIELAGGAARVIRPDPELREEHSRALLASLEWRPTFGRKGSASVEIAAFRTELDDLFDVVESDDPSTDQREFTRVNTSGAVVEGAELSVSLRWGARWWLQAGFVVQRSTFDEPEPDFGSLDFFRTPEEYGVLSIQVRLPRELDLFVAARYTGSMIAPHYAGFIGQDRLERTPSFLELDLNLSRSFDVLGQEVDLTVGAKNVTDAYQEDLDQGAQRDASYVYGPRLPRSVHLGVRWEF